MREFPWMSRERLEHELGKLHKTDASSGRPWLWKPGRQVDVAGSRTEERYMSGTTDTQELYLQGLRNAHALETQALEIMQRQVERLENYPEMKAGLERHIKQTEEQQRRLDQIMQAHGTSYSALKETATGLMGNVTAMMHAATSDEVLKNSFADYAFEHFEIAAYTSLISMAEAAGDQRHIPLLQQTLQEEEEFGKFCQTQIIPTTKKYMQLSASGQTAKV
jgi:ferritin-like metal-binding protein YciE